MSTKDVKKTTGKPKGGKSTFKDARRGGGLRALAANIPEITKKTFGKRGLAEGGLITDWAHIVGPELAASCQPERLAHPRRERSGGTLHIRVYGGAATELQHLEPLILERINGHFGYRAVAKLRLIHAPPPNTGNAAEREPSPPQALNHDQKTSLESLLSRVEDPELRASLGRIGAAILTRTGKIPENPK